MKKTKKIFLNKKKFISITVILLLFLCLYFLIDNKIISSYEDQDFYRYLKTADHLRDDSLYTINQFSLRISYFPKLLWTALISIYMFFIPDNIESFQAIDNLRIYLSLFLIISIVLQRDKYLFLLFTIIIFFLLSSLPFQWLFTEWLRSNLALSLFLLYILWKKNCVNQKEYFSSFLGIFSILMHFSLMPSFFLFELNLRSKKFFIIWKQLSTPLLITALCILFLFRLGIGSELTILFIILFSIVINSFYKSKSKFKFIMASIFLVPFSYVGLIYPFLTGRVFAMIMPIMIFFVHDLIIDLYTLNKKSFNS